MYETRKFFMNFYSLSEYKTDTLIKEIETETGNRYPVGAVIRDGHAVRVRADVFQDYFTNRRQLRDRNTKKFVPDFTEKGAIFWQ